MPDEDLTGTEWSKSDGGQPTVIHIDGDHNSFEGGWLFHYVMVRGAPALGRKHFRIPTHRLRESYARI